MKSWAQKFNLKRLIVRALCILLLSLCGSAAISVAFIKGIELGKDVGRCEAACEISGGTFIALDDDDLCQCQSNGSIKWVYGVSSEFSH